VGWKRRDKRERDEGGEGPHLASLYRSSSRQREGASPFDFDRVAKDVLSVECRLGLLGVLATHELHHSSVGLL
jgi:hypothetical protein